jgi:FkbM family methyltransferase
MNNRLFENCTKLGLDIPHAAEVGVYLPASSNILGFIEQGIRSTLVEADPITVSELRRYFQGNAHVTIVPYAMSDRKGTVTFYRRNASTFLAELPLTPALVNDDYVPAPADSFTVESQLFSAIDDGSIDLLSIDIEGAEWFVIKHQVSRPRVLSVETHGQLYENPFHQEILSWMDENGYEVWYYDRSDTVFIRRGTVPSTLRRTIALFVATSRLRLRRYRKGWQRRLFGRTRKA